MTDNYLPFREENGVFRFPPPDPQWSPLAQSPHNYVVDESYAGIRLDKYLPEVSGISRGMVRELIDFGGVWLQGRVCRKQSRLVESGQEIVMQVPMYGPVKFYEADPDRIVHEDKWVLAYNKEAGPPCQQTPYDGYNHLFGALSRLRPNDYLGLHHRLDRLTSGIMVFSRNKSANLGFSKLFRNGPLEKTYLAVVKGAPLEEEWLTDLPISKKKGGYFVPENGIGKPAQTKFRLLIKGTNTSLIQARPLTGRTHQIRLHLTACGLPILGDPQHGGAPYDRMMLHAWSLSFRHPVTGKDMILTAEPPRGFRENDIL